MYYDEQIGIFFKRLVTVKFFTYQRSTADLIFANFYCDQTYIKGHNQAAHFQFNIGFWFARWIKLQLHISPDWQG